MLKFVWSGRPDKGLTGIGQGSVFQFVFGKRCFCSYAFGEVALYNLSKTWVTPRQTGIATKVYAIFYRRRKCCDKAGGQCIRQSLIHSNFFDYSGGIETECSGVPVVLALAISSAF